MSRRILVSVTLGCGSLAAASPDEDLLADMDRLTIKWVERCSPKTVDIRTFHSGNKVTWGSGTIIHEAGYILTCHHVVTNEGILQVLLEDGTVFAFRKVALLPEYDLAILKVDRAEPFPAVDLARSNTAKLGQPILVIGNPGGQPHSVSLGVISGLRRRAEGLFQTNAVLNDGNSGGPAFDSRGSLLGVVASKVVELDGISYVIPADRVREALAKVLFDEERSGVCVGLKTDGFGPAKITEVGTGSPAAKAGILVGDVIRSAGNLRVSDSIHYWLALTAAKPGVGFPITIERNGKTIALTITPGEAPLLTPPDGDLKDLAQGLRCEIYLGQWQQLPNFEKLKPALTGVVANFGLHVEGGQKDNFGLSISGYIKVPMSGIYHFYTSSDDGSRLWIGDRLVVDNDGMHGPIERNGHIRLKAGIHPITVTYFETTSGEELKVLYEGPNIGKREIPAAVLFHRKQ